MPIAPSPSLFPLTQVIPEPNLKPQSLTLTTFIPKDRLVSTLLTIHMNRWSPFTFIQQYSRWPSTSIWNDRLVLSQFRSWPSTLTQDRSLKTWLKNLNQLISAFCFRFWLALIRFVGPEFCYRQFYGSVRAFVIVFRHYFICLSFQLEEVSPTSIESFQLNPLQLKSFQPRCLQLPFPTTRMPVCELTVL